MTAALPGDARADTAAATGERVGFAFFGQTHVAGDLRGVGIAFGVDVLSCAASGVSLILMHALPALAAGDGAHPLAAVAEGPRFTVGRPVFLWMPGLIAAVNLLLIGPLMVGVPVRALLMLAMLGVQPVLTAMSGAVIGMGATVLFGACGAGVLAVAAVAWAFRGSRSLEAPETGAPASAESAA